MTKTQMDETVAKLVAENAALKTENERLKDIVEVMNAEYSRLMAHIERFRALAAETP